VRIANIIAKKQNYGAFGISVRIQRLETLSMALRRFVTACATSIPINADQKGIGSCRYWRRSDLAVHCDRSAGSRHPLDVSMIPLFFIALDLVEQYPEDARDIFIVSLMVAVLVAANLA
jgi:hypothetical protein